MAAIRKSFADLRRDALLDNPLLDFDKLLVVERSVESPQLGLPRNWQGNSSLPQTGFDDRVATLSLADLTDGREAKPKTVRATAHDRDAKPAGGVSKPVLTTLYKPAGGRFVGDVDLHFDAERLLFSMPGDNGRWQVFEIRVDGTGLRQLTGEQPDVDSYDACYLPSGKIVFTSTACFVGVPCVYGSSHVANLYLMDGDGRSIRQLCFDQEHNWCPTVLADGRVLYTRWEYTGTPHSNTRLLFHMNPDGTQQIEYYGSNSYWPNAFFYARPIPGHPSKVVAVIGGHHDNPRMGELLIFDSAQGRREADGAVQRIPGHGKRVEPIIRDGLTSDSWPKFLHPYPLSEKYFLVACKPSPQSLWGIYLVDVFDNRLLLHEEPGHALLEPIPLRKTPAPPVIAEKVDLANREATVYLSDIYAGKGLRGIPRGTVKSLRIFTYHYAYQEMGGLLGVVGMDGPWDIKRVLGTVPVFEDGSAKFQIPANTPISIQPLDEQGKALQLMRSWMTAMPGEVVACHGCHASPRRTPPPLPTRAQSAPVAKIEPWHGPTRGFSYAREVQPVIDRYCLDCHDGAKRASYTPPDLRGDVQITDWRSVTPGNGGAHAGKFSVGYAELHRYVRRPGIESDYHMLEPMEYHADTTELVQMLNKGHHNVHLDAEAWDRLITWIDLNCPYHGTWGEQIDHPGPQRQRRGELLHRYAGIDDDPEAVLQTVATPLTAIDVGNIPRPENGAVRAGGGTDAKKTAIALPEPLPAEEPQVVTCPDWPYPADGARRRQQAAGPETIRTVELGDGIALKLALIPAGAFIMGNRSGGIDERPLRCMPIERPFWIGTCEISNAQFQQFDSFHDSRVESKNAYQFGIHGYPVNRPEQPVVRVSWNQAMKFCDWLSQRTGQRFTLPTEAQWEYTCRAGTATTFFHGDRDADFSTFANLADATLSQFASDPYTIDTPLVNPTKYDDWIPKENRFQDGALLSVASGHYRPNAWGLHDMHGNVAEWTRTAYRPYPYVAADGRDALTAEGRRVVRGGSWRDRPERCTSSFRLSYEPYQRVFNVGFRVICEEIKL